MDSFRLMALTLGKLGSNVCDTNDIQCDKWKRDMELVNISIKCIASLECKGGLTKKI